jgi:Skp family chaperone for outer membrane proteins
MAKELFVPHYDVSFKRMVIEEYLSTGCTKAFLLKKHGITFKSAIQTWMRILGYTDPNKAVQKPKFGKLTFTSLPKKVKKTEEGVSQLQKKIQELERQLEDEKLRSEAYARVIEKAEQELKIPIRKKLNTK